METLFAVLNRRGLLLVFLWVLLEQAGIPLPAPPLLVTAGALAQEGAWRAEWVVAIAVAACLIADHAWFIAGRMRGRTLLAGICRLSLSPEPSGEREAYRKARDIAMTLARPAPPPIR